MLRNLAVVSLLSGLLLGGLVAFGILDPIMLAVAGMALVFAFILWKLGAASGRGARRVAELPTRGIRRRGRVRDCVPYTNPETGMPAHDGDRTMMVLDVELLAEDGSSEGHERVHVMEPAEDARARVGTEVTVLSHPEDPLLKALDGFLPSGMPRRSTPD